MKTQLISKLLTTNWDLSPAQARAFLSTLLPRLRGERPAEDVFGDPLPKMSVQGDIAVIPIRGVLMMNVPQWLKDWGCNITDVNDIAEELTEALSDPRVTAIVADFDSPGGWSIAGHKLFDMMEAAASQKPLFSWADDGADMASAAFNGAAPSRMILTGPFSCVGSIGSYCVQLDDSDFWKQLGITIEVFRSGEFKGMGEDSLTAAQREFIQATTDSYGARIRANVAKYRTELPAAEMRGQYYDGSIAAEKGFTHGTAPDLASAITRFRAFV